MTDDSFDESYSSIGRSCELSYDIGEIGESRITENVYRGMILIFETLTKSAIRGFSTD